jgi:hypothetical protein
MKITSIVRKEVNVRIVRDDYSCEKYSLKINNHPIAHKISYQADYP